MITYVMGTPQMKVNSPNPFTGQSYLLVVISLTDSLTTQTVLPVSKKGQNTRNGWSVQTL